MCMYYNNNDTQNFINKCKKNHKRHIIVYKLINKHGSTLFSSICSKKWKVGTNISNIKKNQYKQLFDGDNITNGLHVYINYNDAKNRLYSNRCILILKVDIKDLIGVNGYTAVFRKVFLSQENYNKAIRYSYENSPFLRQQQ